MPHHTHATTVHFLCVVPSPYQRDIFEAMHEADHFPFHVWYLEASTPDSPWPEVPLRNYETILHARWIAWGSSRFHFGRIPKRMLQCDCLVLNGIMNTMAQRVLRMRKRPPVVFWGERIGHHARGAKTFPHQRLTAPLQQVQAIAGIGCLAKEDYRKRFPSVPVIENIPYYTNIAPFMQVAANKKTAREYDIPSEEPTILFCGQMIQRKGIDVLLRAFESLIHEGVKARLLLLGRRAELPEWLKSLSADARERIEYVGFQAPQDLPRYFAQADLFTLPSRFDGWGVVINQALAAGLPIIATNAVGAAHDCIEEGHNGFRIQPDSVDALTNSLRALCTDPEKRCALGRASREKAEQWTPQAGAHKWLSLVQVLQQRVWHHE